MITNINSKLSNISVLFQAKQSVFSFKDLAIFWKMSDKNKLKSLVNYYVRAGKLKRISRGFYFVGEVYDRREYANKKFVPSYISFETVLKEEGLVFQPYYSIFIASLSSKTVLVDKQNYVYRKLKKEILMNPLGVNKTGAFARAIKERAYLDLVYLTGAVYLDNNNLDREKIKEILPIYKNKKMEKKIKKEYELE